MNTNIKLLIGVAALVVSFMLFYIAAGGILLFIRGFLLALGIVFIIRSLIEKSRK